MANVTWTKSGAGNWTTTTNWNTVAVPAAGDDVFITNEGTATTVTVNTNTAALGSLLINNSTATVTSSGTRTLNVTNRAVK